MASRGGVAADVAEVGNAIDNDERRGCDIGGIHGGQREVFLVEIQRVWVCETDVLTFRSRRTIKSPIHYEPPMSRNSSVAFNVPLNAAEHMYYIHFAEVTDADSRDC